MNHTARTLDAIRTRGWRVVLLGPRTKKPAGAHWHVTTDVDCVTTHLDAGGNLGLVAHESNGIAVLDADDLLAWADMIDTLGQPAAAWTETGRGRLHYFVAWEPDLPAKLEWRGQIIGEIQRGPGQQQVVIPPSVHPDAGRRYRWIFDPVKHLSSLCLANGARTCGGRSMVVAADNLAELRAAALRQPGVVERTTAPHALMEENVSDTAPLRRRRDPPTPTRSPPRSTTRAPSRNEMTPAPGACTRSPISDPLARRPVPPRVLRQAAGARMP